MSRNYEVQLDIAPCNLVVETAIPTILIRWGMDIAGDVYSVDHDGDDGQIQLGQDDSLEDKHEELRTQLPERTITSRWRYLDDQPWDEVIEIVVSEMRPAQQSSALSLLKTKR
jgi:hypothetical protein